MRQLIQLSNIKIIAHFKGVTLPDLAKRVGLTYFDLSKIMKTNDTSLTSLFKLAETLDVPMQCFFVKEKDLKQAMHWDLDLPIEAIREYRMNEMILAKAMEKIVDQEILITTLKNQVVALELKKQVRKQNGGS